MSNIENEIGKNPLNLNKPNKKGQREMPDSNLQNMQNIPIVSKEDIVRALKGVGVTPGSIVLIHSSLKSFGYVVSRKVTGNI